MRINARRLTLLLSMLLVFCFVFVTAVQAANTKSARKAGTPNAKITVKQAEKIALKKYPGKIVEKTKIENEEGVWQYSVMVKSGKTLREVMVNAQTGKIDNVEITTGAKEKDEAAKDKKKGKDEGKSEKNESGEKEDAETD